MRRRAIIAAAGLAAPAALLACTRAARAADRKLAVTHYGALAYGIPVGAAWRAGYFAEAGARFDGLLTADGGGTAVRNTLASDLPVGESGLYAVMAARRTGLDLVVIYAAIASVADAGWAVRADSPIRGLQDLAGQKVTFTQPKSGSETQIREILRTAGMTDTVQLVASGGIREGLAMVEAGSAAAAPIVEPMRTVLAAKFRVVVDAQEHLPRSSQIVGFTTRAFADANGELLRGIVAGRARGVDLTDADPAAAARLVQPDYKLPQETLEAVIRTLAARRFWSRGPVELADLQAAEPLMAHVGATDGKPVDWSRVLDQRFAPPKGAAAG